MDRLQLQNRELRGVKERLARKERRARELKKKNAHLGEQHTALLEDYEACQEQVSHGADLSFFDACDENLLLFFSSMASAVSLKHIRSPGYIMNPQRRVVVY